MARHAPESVQHTFSKERVQVDNSVDAIMNGLFDNFKKNE